MFLRNSLKLNKILKAGVLGTIEFYRKYLSPNMLCKCRYYPSCSEYTVNAVKHRGVFLGLLKGIGRILRCNPFFPGGYDPYKR